MHPKRLFGILYGLGLMLLILWCLRSIPQDPIGALGSWLYELSWNSKSVEEKRSIICQEYMHKYNETGIYDSLGLSRDLEAVKDKK